MRLTNFFHFIAAVSCIPVFFKDWSSATVTLVWIISSYLNSYAAYHRKIEIENIQREKNELIEKMSDLEMKAWEAQMKLATKNIESKTK